MATSLGLLATCCKAGKTKREKGLHHNTCSEQIHVFCTSLVGVGVPTAPHCWACHSWACHCWACHWWACHCCICCSCCSWNCQLAPAWKASCLAASSFALLSFLSASLLNLLWPIALSLCRSSSSWFLGWPCVACMWCSLCLSLYEPEAVLSPGFAASQPSLSLPSPFSHHGLFCHDCLPQPPSSHFHSSQLSFLFPVLRTLLFLLGDDLDQAGLGDGLSALFRALPLLKAFLWPLQAHFASHVCWTFERHTFATIAVLSPVHVVCKACLSARLPFLQGLPFEFRWLPCVHLLFVFVNQFCPCLKDGALGCTWPFAMGDKLFHQVLGGRLWAKLSGILASLWLSDPDAANMAGKPSLPTVTSQDLLSTLVQRHQHLQLCLLNFSAKPFPGCRAASDPSPML